MTDKPDSQDVTIDHQLTAFSTHLQAVIGLASVAINAIILANSAAIGAVLAFLGSIWDPGNSAFRAILADSVDAIQVFVIGVTAGIMSAGLSYLSQFTYSRADMSDSETLTRWLVRIALAMHVLAGVGGFIGTFAFPVGAWRGLDLLSSLP